MWDKQTQTIVNNESAEIIRMFNSAFDQVGANPGDYYAADLREEIDSLSKRIYNTVNNGVYKGGFAMTQTAYEEAFLWGYPRELYQLPGIAQTVNFSNIKRHYYQSHEIINPIRIVPEGPEINFMKPHNQEL